MFKDEIFKAILGDARYRDDEHSEVIKVRVDIEIPHREWGKIHPALGHVIGSLAGEDVGFGNLHFMKEFPSFDLTFAPTFGDLHDGNYCTEIQAVAFNRKAIVARKAPKDDDDGEERFYLYLTTSLPRSQHNRDFVDAYFNAPAYCRFIARQEELDLEEKQESEEHDE